MSNSRFDQLNFNNNTSSNSNPSSNPSHHLNRLSPLHRNQQNQQQLQRDDSLKKQYLYSQNQLQSPLNNIPPLPQQRYNNNITHRSLDPFASESPSSSFNTDNMQSQGQIQSFQQDQQQQQYPQRQQQYLPQQQQQQAYRSVSVPSVPSSQHQPYVYHTTLQPQQSLNFGSPARSRAAPPSISLTQSQNQPLSGPTNANSNLMSSPNFQSYGGFNNGSRSQVPTPAPRVQSAIQVGQRVQLATGNQKRTVSLPPVTVTTSQDALAVPERYYQQQRSPVYNQQQYYHQPDSTSSNSSPSQQYYDQQQLQQQQQMPPQQSQQLQQSQVPTPQPSSPSQQSLQKSQSQSQRSPIIRQSFGFLRGGRNHSSTSLSDQNLLNGNSNGKDLEKYHTSSNKATISSSGRVIPQKNDIVNVNVSDPPKKTRSLSSITRRVASTTSMRHSGDKDRLYSTGSVSSRNVPPPATSASTRRPYVYPAVLSRVARAFKERVQLGSCYKNGLEYRNAFTGADAVDIIARIIRTSDRNLALLLGRSLVSEVLP
ncbi:unnamed protein product [Ambrosiozyma monospora]|uniref:Unnamed protein product n=1 Tax=Ambrosiozyma monospora TaxID=43982 RepID=A0ACB5T9V8_AMBMO|nr:unnamed protein product [Ambrosiozyma monospora]